MSSRAGVPLPTIPANFASMVNDLACDTARLNNINSPSLQVATIATWEPADTYYHYLLSYSRVTTLSRVPGHVDRVLSQHQGHGLGVCAVVLAGPPVPVAQGRSKPESRCDTSALSLVLVLVFVYLVYHLIQDHHCSFGLP